MPNPKTGTVTFEVGKAVADIRKDGLNSKLKRLVLCTCWSEKCPLIRQSSMTMHRPFLNLSLRQSLLPVRALSQECHDYEHDGTRSEVGYHRTDEAVELDEGRRSSMVGLEGPVAPGRSVVDGESS